MENAQVESSMIPEKPHCRPWNSLQNLKHYRIKRIAKQWFSTYLQKRKQFASREHLVKQVNRYLYIFLSMTFISFLKHCKAYHFTDNTSLFFSVRVFFHAQALTIHRTVGEGRGPSFIPLYHFHLLKSQTFFHLFCNFACEIIIYF